MNETYNIQLGDSITVTVDDGWIDDWYRDDYNPEHFVDEEFVDPSTFHRLSQKGLDVLGGMDIRMLITADEIREYFDKPMVINNWKWGGNRKWSGLRTKDSENFSYDSQHTYGRALDFYMKGISSQEIRDEIKSHYDVRAFRFITRMEEFDGMSWVHVDCKKWDKSNGIYVFKP